MYMLEVIAFFFAGRFSWMLRMFSERSATMSLIFGLQYVNFRASYLPPTISPSLGRAHMPRMVGPPIQANSFDHSHDRERMPHLFLLGPQVRQCIRAWRCFAGNQFADFDSTLCQCFNFLRVVCH